MPETESYPVNGHPPIDALIAATPALAADAARARALAAAHGAAFFEHVRYNPVVSLNALERELAQVRGQVAGLYDSLDLHWRPPGWLFLDADVTEADGIRVWQTRVRNAHAHWGYFERGYHRASGRLELRYAFRRLRRTNHALGGWIAGVPVPLVPGRGTSPALYVTLYQFKAMGVPAGRPRAGGACYLCSSAATFPLRAAV